MYERIAPNAGLETLIGQTAVEMAEVVALPPSPEFSVGGRAGIGSYLSRALRRLVSPSPAGPQGAREATADGNTTERAGNIQIAKLIENRGYACAAPRFSDQVLDATRTNVFRYGFDPCSVGSRGSRTEHEGLLELWDFLASHPESSKAAGMLENLTFIGEKELAEASKGLAAYWKRYLDKDSQTQLCVLTTISAGLGENKSDQYVLERILSHFTDEELKKYSGRLLVDPERLTAPVNKAKIVMLDDWVISGGQMRAMHESTVVNNGHLSKYVKGGRVEVNVLAASQRHLKRGLERRQEIRRISGEVPIKAYFLAHDASFSSSNQRNGAHISGTHSSVDYDFCNSIVAISLSGSHRSSDSKPALYGVVRAYRDIVRSEYQRVRQLGLPVTEGNGNAS